MDNRRLFRGIETGGRLMMMGAGLDQVDIDFVKDLRMPRQRLRESQPLLHLLRHLFQDGPEVLDRFVVKAVLAEDLRFAESAFHDVGRQAGRNLFGRGGKGWTRGMRVSCWRTF